MIRLFDSFDFDMMLKYELLRSNNFVINLTNVSIIIKNIRNKKHIIRFQFKQKNTTNKLLNLFRYL